MHFENDNIDYSATLSFLEIVDYLSKKGISSNYNEPMTREQVKRMGENKCRQIYNNIMATHNLVNIQQVHGEDLEITDTDKYDYILTYSFPCQDLSKAGLGKGMQKGSGTRSGMLWEVERILDECNENLPQILLMENVPDVIGSKNIEHFAKWLEKLESLGYKCYWQVLNAKNYGVPQNRERCFMVSILGDYYYDFPKPIKLEHRLKDLLEDNVDEKYYLSDRALQGALNTSFCCSKLENKLPKDGICPTICARDYKDPKCVQVAQLEGGFESTGRVYSPNGLCPTINTCGGGNREPKIATTNGVSTAINTSFMPNVAEKNLKQKLCIELIASGKVKENDVIRHSYSTNRMQNWDKRGVEHNDMCPTLDTRCDCLGIVVNSNNKRLKSLISNTELGEDTLALDCYNQSVHKDCIHTIKCNVDSNNMTAIYTDYRIRKLTPKECFRLMGVKDEDFEKIAKNQSNASLYHLAGDSIVVPVLVAIFGQFVKDFDFNKYIENFYKQIKGEKSEKV